MPLRDYQIEALEAVREHLLAGVWSQILVLPTGCHAAGQGILMFDGTIKPVEEIVVGDRLMGPDSQPRTVLRLVRGEDDLVDIVPVKGEPWRVNLDHVLTLVRTNQGGPYPSRQGGVIQDVTVREWRTWTRNGKHLHKLFRVPVEFVPTGELPLDPYFLGLILGDGSLTQSKVAVSKPDHQVRDECARQAALFGLTLTNTEKRPGKCPSWTLWGRPKVVNPIAAILRALGLMPIQGRDRFVPHVYKTASREHRLAILAGLIDTDGALSGAGYDFSSISERLAHDVAFLARSVGLAAYVTGRTTRDQHGTACFSHRVSISGNLAIVPCRIPRKRAPERRQIKDHRRTGFSVEPAGRGEYFGFTLDGDGRYLLDDFTVTHNSGKTFVFAHLPLALRDWLCHFPRQRMLILAHREELLQQAATHLREINPSLSVGVEQGEYRAGPLDDVVIASVQTLTAAGARRLQALSPDDFRIIVVDEAHHTPAVSYQKVLRHFGVIPPEALRPSRDDLSDEAALHRARDAHFNWWVQQPSNRLLLGVTATPKRADGIGLEWSYRTIAYERDLKFMVERGYLVPPRGLLVDTATDLDGVHTVAGDFKQDELAKAVNTPERNALAVSAWKARARNKHAIVRPTLAFTVDVEHARDVAAAFQAAGVKADWASGERREAVAAFKSGAIDVLASCNLVTEGFDHPPAGIALMLRPTKSQTLYAQCVGRVLRLAPMKYDALILDVVDVTKRHALVSAGDLFGLPERFNAGGKALLSVAARVEAIQQRLPEASMANLHSLDEIEARMQKIDLWSVREPVPEVAAARLTWVQDGPGRFHLGLPSRAADGALRASSERLRIQQDLLGRWTVTLADSLGARMVSDADTLRHALAAAEEWVRRERRDVYQMQNRHAGWRRRKASPKQVARLQRLGATHLDFDALTRGEAAMLLDQYYVSRDFGVTHA